MSDKPAFNPNAAFEAADAKPAFDPNAAHEVADAPAAQPIGYMDQLVADAESQPDPVAAYKQRHANDSVGQKLMNTVSAPADSPVVGGMPPLVSPAGAIPALGKLAQLLSGSAKARMGTNAALGAAQGAYHAPEGQRLEGAAKGGALGAGLGGLGEGLGSLLGGSANNAMKRAVGITGAASKKAPADIGTRLIDEGIWGTKAGMAQQVGNKYGAVENEIQALAEQLPGEVPATKLADEVAATAQQHINPETGLPISGGESAVATKRSIADLIRKGGKGYSPAQPGPVSEVATEFTDSAGNPIKQSVQGPAIEAQEGTYGGRALMKLKRQGDSEAFNQSGLMGNSHTADAYRAQADAARKGLSDISEGQMPELLKREQTMLLANRGLMQPEMLAKNPMSLTDIGSALVGSQSGGLPGAGTATLASKAVAAPFAQSAYAHGANAAGKGAKALVKPGFMQALAELLTRKED